MSIDKEISLVIVTFNPHDDSICNIIHISRKFRVILVSNGMLDEQICKIGQAKGVSLIRNANNLGLAKALNQGIYEAFSNPNCEAVILLDQDTKVSDQFPSDLRKAYRAINDPSVAALAPLLKDCKSPETNVGTLSSTPFQEVETLATSGTYIPRFTFVEVGGMLEDLFIDCIDHEWCFRARSKGFKIIRTNTVVISHNMGDSYLNLFGRFIPFHKSLIRHYYITRNIFILSKIKYVPLRWKCTNIAKLMLRMPIYIIISERPAETIKGMIRALLDAFRFHFDEK